MESTVNFDIESAGLQHLADRFGDYFISNPSNVIQMDDLVFKSLKYHPANRHLLSDEELKTADEQLISICEDIITEKYGIKQNYDINATIEKITYFYTTYIYKEFRDNLEHFSIVVKSATQLYHEKGYEQDANIIETLITVAIFDWDCFMDNSTLKYREHVFNIIAKIVETQPDRERFAK